MPEMTAEALRIAAAILPGFLAVKIRDFFRSTRPAGDAFDRFMEVVAFAVVNYFLVETAYRVFFKVDDPWTRDPKRVCVLARWCFRLSWSGFGNHRR